jgi:hypothetical protein
MSYHVSTAKIFYVGTPIVATAVATGIGVELNWDVILTALLAAGVSSTISAIASVFVAMYLKQPLTLMIQKQDDTHVMLNSQKAALEALQRADAARANKAEGELKGIASERIAATNKEEK